MVTGTGYIRHQSASRYVKAYLLDVGAIHSYIAIVGERSSTGLFTTIPWPNGEPMGPSFTDGKGRYMTPIWVNNTSSEGTLYMLIMDRQGRPSYRKLYIGAKPVECIGALSQAGTPILALRTTTTAWLLKITEVGDPQVDSLPRFSHYTGKPKKIQPQWTLVLACPKPKACLLGFSQKQIHHPNQPPMQTHMLVQSVSLVFKDNRYRQRHSPNPT